VARPALTRFWLLLSGICESHSVSSFDFGSNSDAFEITVNNSRYNYGLKLENFVLIVRVSDFPNLYLLRRSLFTQGERGT